jgi:hypothetical protein
VAPNEHVTIVDGEAAFPDVAADHGRSDNRSDPFTIRVAPGTPHGTVVTLLLTVTCDGFQQTFDVAQAVGYPELLTHDVGGVYLTVTDQGIIGYLDEQQRQGQGMGRAGEGSSLFLGSFWAGNDENYVCARDYPGTPERPETHEWQVRRSPTGRMRSLEREGVDQIFSATYTDSGHAEPRHVVVEQTSLAWATSPDDRFVVMEFHVTNAGSAPLPDYVAGLFCDWDVGDPVANRGGVDPERHAIYVHEHETGPYFGVALLDDGEPGNLTFLDNVEHLYADWAIADAVKLASLRGELALHATPAASDWSVVCAAASRDLAPGDEFTVAFALVHGDDLAGWRANVDAARAAYDLTTPASDELPVKVFRLAQNQPNPFNPRTTLAYEVARPGPVELTVHDIRGRLVRTLVAAHREPGDYEASWDGTDVTGRRVPSGLYFAVFRAGDQIATRKMTLVK